jgi:peptidyl-tRNA hydrolase
MKKTKKEKFIAWDRHGQKKVVLKAKNLDEMMKIKDKCNKLRITHVMISDAGLTELTPGTITAMAIGPDDEKKIDNLLTEKKASVIIIQDTMMKNGQKL